MDIVIVAQYLRNIEVFEGNNNRFVYLAKLLTKHPENQIEIVTTDFYHGTKSHFKKVDKLPGVTVTALHESGYPKNVCLKRFSSHKELAGNISRYLDERKIPDVCYCSVPSLDVADAVAAYCKKNNVRFIVDVQDLWPEAFKMVFHVPVVSNLIFAPMQKKANRVYAQADQIIAVSQTYVDRAMSVNTKCQSPMVTYLGTEKATFDGYAVASVDDLKKYAATAPGTRDQVYEELVSEVLAGREIIRIAYCGTLGHSYDITCVIDAIRKLDEADRSRIEFIVMGDGPKMAEFVSKAEGLPIRFTGRLTYPEMVWLLSRCDIAVNPIAKGAAQSIINKHMDYAMAGLPVINTQECPEYRNLVEAYKAGVNCACDNSDDVAEAIRTLCHDGALRAEMGVNSRKLASDRFDRAKTYAAVCQIMMNGKEKHEDSGSQS